jgi:hypothetical protein
MGEKSAKGESILGYLGEKEAYCLEDKRFSIQENIAYLNSFDADKLKYVHSKAFCYNQSKFNSTFEAALMVESKGERKNEF